MTDRSNYAIGLADDYCDQDECDVHSHRTDTFVSPVEYDQTASQPLTIDIDAPCADPWCRRKASRLEVRVSTFGVAYTYLMCDGHTQF